MNALSDLVVADFSRVLAAPYATMLLADMGADVIKVEHPERGDETRGWGPPFAGQEATYFLSVNRNKRSLGLDLADPVDNRRAHELVRRADVVVENFRPGTMAKYGLAYEQVSEINSGVVYCSITGFGSEEGADLPGYDLLVQAVGGLMSVTGQEPGQPVKTGVAVVDVLTGLHAMTGILAALRHRDATGQGQLVEANLLTSLLSGLVNQSAGYTLAGAVPGAMGNRRPSVAPYELFATADVPMVLAVGNDRQFATLCDGIGVPELARDQRFTTNSDRVAHVEELGELLAKRLRERTAKEWFDLLTPLGVPCGPVNDVAGAFALADDLGLRSRASIGRAGDAEDDAAEFVANPLSLSETPPVYRARPPHLGEHTAEIVAWLDGDEGR
ncbi:Crotonobetainyl-CoA:carnitine CoA-transferase CaiB [Haloechinothrix alba]|uniref:Crotonobetainyl-CoA:carnitine CoA-transferase CaiB n=1 Tax=Haloechinothrix alba TaxID=664784 RepID=A0A238VQN7_9PSEU|nr:CoA transferase [Haloechinothrix alba]SNR36464.1 Crotonobetainyl-CoA:carnitine CoA-transferase CaiB [Haloechinothrix alba]